MAQASGLGQLSENDWRRLQEAADRFEKAWQDDQRTDLASFLPPPGDNLRGHVLHELIKIDLEMQARRKRLVVLEDYLAQFPELGTIDTLPATLIYEEYQARCRYGDRPRLENCRHASPASSPTSSDWLTSRARWAA